MATLPYFIFPFQDNADLGFTINSRITESLHLHTQTPPKKEETYTLKLPKRPAPLTIASTPPDSPPSSWTYAMNAQNAGSSQYNGAITPPITPVKSSHAQPSSASSLADSFKNVGPSDKPPSTPRKSTSVDPDEQPGSTSLRIFPPWISDYEIQTDEEGAYKPIGTGLWSNVFLANPILPTQPEQDAITMQLVGLRAELTPPITPVHSRGSSLSKDKFPDVPSAYAIKYPATASSRKVLKEEARILSYLSRFSGADKYIVPFYGQDLRTDSIILKLMDDSLENCVTKHLNTLPTENARTEALSAIFPRMAADLLDGLEWMNKNGCTHVDVKPGNILVSTPEDAPLSSSSTLKVVYTDFSSSLVSALLPIVNETSTSKLARKRSLGGGTWTYLDPSLCKSSADPPSFTTDLWSVAMTLLFVVLGASPFEWEKNDFRRRELTKQGDPLALMTYGDDGCKNLLRVEKLAAKLGVDVKGWFKGVLVKEVKKRMGFEEWRGELKKMCGV